MGHANISTTMGYAQITEQKISDDMDKLMAKRKKKGVNPCRTLLFATNGESPADLCSPENERSSLH